MRRRPIPRLASLALAGLFFALPLLALSEDRSDAEIGHAQGVVAQNGMVVAQEALAARIGVDILQKGGNAVDAAVAVGFALAVTYPRAGNIGGGGFMMIHRANGEDIAIDYRETAPQAIDAKSFLDAQGNADPQKSRDSALAIGVPGTVAGLALAEQKYGSGKFYARRSDRAGDRAGARRHCRSPTTPRIRCPAIARAAGALAVLGEDLSQARRQRARARRPAGADRPRRLRCKPSPKAGRARFTKARSRQKLAAAVQAAGGVMTADDLKDYRAVERAPVRGTYRGYDIVSMPPPSSGGVALDRDAQHPRRLRSRPRRRGAGAASA